MYRSSQKPQLTVVSAKKPKYLTKTIRLNEEGKLEKRRGGALVSGCANVVEVDGLEGLAQLVPKLGPDQALIYGLPPEREVKLVTVENYEATGGPSGVYPRTAEHFSWPEGPAFMMFDYDPHEGQRALGRNELIEILRGSVEGLADARMLWWASASSNIVNEDIAAELSAIRGQRIVIAVKDGTDIERAGKAVCDHLWAAGYGRYDVSKSGQRLERTLVDRSVWQSNRIDFAAGAKCEPPLIQRREEPVLIGGMIAVVDTRKAIPDAQGDVKKRADANRDAARDAVNAEASATAQKWKNEYVARQVSLTSTPEIRGVAEATARLAVEQSILTGDFPIIVVKNGNKSKISVGDLLANRFAYHGALTLDPMEPEYMGDKVVGKLYLAQTRPILHSQAHGGCTYRLQRQPLSVMLTAGETRRAVDETLEHLRAGSDIYEYGSAMVAVHGEKLSLLNADGLAYELGGYVQYIGHDAQGRERRSDPPVKLVKQMLSAPERGLRPINALVNAPTLRADGTVISNPGYDNSSQLMLTCPRASSGVVISDHPTLDQVRAAVTTLWNPFKDFPFVSEADRAVMLAALLTAVVRPSLPTVPAFGFDAPVQGSGKTLLSKCIGILSSGEPPGVYAMVREEDEIRKRLTTILGSGERAVIWDNVLGHFDSGVMAAFLTSETWNDRILGASVSVSLPNRIITIFNGNNLAFGGDMVRRVLTCRIDPQMETPFTRAFDLDPAAFVRVNRMKLNASALTIIRGYLTSDPGRAKGSMASFENWDAWVRQPIAWLGRDVLPGQFGDVMEVVAAAQAESSTQDALSSVLELWFEAYDDKWMTVGEVLSMTGVDIGRARALNAALGDFVGDRPGSGALTAQRLGKLFAYKRDVVLGGLKLECKAGAKNTKMWRVVNV